MELTTLRDAYGQELRGLRCRAAIASEEPLITVPAPCALQVTTGGAPPANVPAESWSRLAWWAQLALLLLEAREGPLKGWLQSLPAMEAQGWVTGVGPWGRRCP